MADETDLPRPHPRSDGRATLHGTAVERAGRALVLLGPSGAGKSGLAAEMLLLGARLVADDLLLLERREGSLRVSGPDAGEAANAAGEGWDPRANGAMRPMELRGIGVVRVPATAAAPVCGAVLLSPCPERLPEAENMTLLGVGIPLTRHPARAGAAAKLLLWLAALPVITAPR